MCSPACRRCSFAVNISDRPDKLTVRLALDDMRDGLRYLGMQKAIMTLMAAILFINFFFAPVADNFIPYFVKTDIALAPSYLFDRFLTPELWSSVFSVLIGISSLVGSALLSGRAQEEKCGQKVTVCLGIEAVIMIVMTACYRLMVDRGDSLNGFLLLFGAELLVTGLILPFINIPVSTALMRTVERDKLSKVSSIISILSQGLIPIASVLAGLVLQYLGSSALLSACSAGFSAAALFLLLSKEVKTI